MREKKDKQDIADRIIREEILREGTRLEEALGPVTFQESPDFDYDESFRRLCEKREAQEQRKKEIGEMVHRQEASKSAVFSGKAQRHGKRRWRGVASPVVKVAVACIVLVAGIFAFSMTSEATRMWWMDSIERVVGGSSGTVIDNDEKRVKSDTTEQDAAAEIKEKTGIDVPKFLVRPDGLVFDAYEYNVPVCFAYMYYLIEEQVVFLYVKGADTDTSSDFNYDGEILNSNQIETKYGNVSLKEVKADGDNQSTAVAEWKYRNHYYCIIGKIEMETLKSMVESMYF